jgi:assimilatory nitrate reductase catalytic subunit
VTQFGPHLKREPAGGWATRGDPDRIVPTHCCFCGQQCGIQLKVKDEKIVGFEPWEAFPFNKGKLCPKGVKRYMQDEHPDRLLTPLHATRHAASSRSSGTRRSTAPRARSSASSRRTDAMPSPC